jgi:recombination protein RecR
MSQPDPLKALAEQLQRLPGIGAKSAQRLAFHILKTPREEIDRLAGAMRDVKERVTYCSTCSNITDVDPCFYCTSPERDRASSASSSSPRTSRASRRPTASAACTTC